MNTIDIVRNFLATLDSSTDEKFAIETYSDLPKDTKSDPDSLKRRWKNLSADDVIKLIPDLKDLNQKGAAIYIAVNEFDGFRAKNNLSHLRCVHADMDYATDEQLATLKECCSPTLIVESSLGRFHFYWMLESRLEPRFMAEVESINRELLKFGADKAATDCSRLLRIPGFLNKKRVEGMHCVNITSSAGPRYSIESIKHALGIQMCVGTSKQVVRQTVPSTDDDSVIEQIRTLMSQAEPSLMAGNWEKHPGDPDWMIGYESQSDADLALAGKIARVAAAEGVSHDALPMIVEEVFGSSGLAQRDKWKSRQDYRDRTIKMALSDFGPTNKSETKVMYQPDVKKVYGDVLNGHKFAEFWRGRMIYVTTLNKWLKWSGV